MQVFQIFKSRSRKKNRDALARETRPYSRDSIVHDETQRKHTYF